jgi:hypothetical protein
MAENYKEKRKAETKIKTGNLKLEPETRSGMEPKETK